MKTLFISVLFLSCMFSNSFAGSITGPTTVCKGTEYTYTAQGANATAYNFQWKLSKGVGTIISGQGSDKIVVIWNMDGTGAVACSYTYTYYYTDGNGNPQSYETIGYLPQTNDIKVINPLGVVTLTASPKEVCEGETVTLTATGSNSSGTFYYTWGTGEHGSSLNVTPAVGTTTYGVEAIIMECPVHTIQEHINVITYSKPVVSVTSNTTQPLCAGTSSTVPTSAVLTATGANTYSWSHLSDLSTDQGSSVTVSPQVTTTYTVTGHNGGCAVDASIIVPVYPTVNVTASANDLCPGETSVLTGSNATTYAWTTVPDQFSATGQTVTTPPAGTDNYSNIYTVTGQYKGCATSKSVTITSLGVPKPILTGNDRLCVNPVDQWYTVIIGNAGNSSFSWSVPSTLGTIVEGRYSQSCRINFNDYFTGNERIYCTVTNRCSTATGNYTVFIDPAIQNPPTVHGCDWVSRTTPGSSYYLQQFFSGADWEVTPAQAITSKSVSPMGQVNVTWNPSYLGNVSFRARLQNGCGVSGWSPYFNVSVIDPTTLINGPASVKGGIASQYSSSKTGTITWSITPAAAASSSTTDASGNLSVIWSKAFAGTATLTLSIKRDCEPNAVVTTKSIAVATADLCASKASSDLDTRIDRVVFAGIDKTSPNTCRSYTDYSVLSAYVNVGKTYPLTVTAGTCGAVATNKKIRVYIDWNNDRTFAGTESIGTSPYITTATGSHTFNVTVPSTAVAGSRVAMRVMCFESTSSTNIPNACDTYGKGETQDYTVNIYCPSASSSGTGTSITQVTFAGINNTLPNACRSFTDYSDKIAAVTPGSTYPLTVGVASCSTTINAKRVAVFIDWNNNRVFDETPLRSVSYSTATATYNVNVTVPGSTPNGTRVKMRVVTYEGNNLAACDTYTNGETQDYTVAIGTQPAVRLGNFSIREEGTLPESSDSSFVSVYPNPFENGTTFSIFTKTAKTLKLELFNITGVLVKVIADQTFSEGSHEILVDFSSLPAGTYYYKLTGENTNLVNRLIKY